MNYNTNLIERFIQFFDLTVVELLRTAIDMAVIPLFFFSPLFFRRFTRYDARSDDDKKWYVNYLLFYLTTTFQHDDDDDDYTNHSIQTNIIPFLQCWTTNLLIFFEF